MRAPKGNISEGAPPSNPTRSDKSRHPLQIVSALSSKSGCSQLRKLNYRELGPPLLTVPFAI